jgi:putative endonuclease
MHYVYILNSIPYPDKFYVGYTLDVHDRLNVHNEGGSVYTKEYKPWKLFWYCVFETKDKALEFEKYLKSHSGRAFAKKRLG